MDNANLTGADLYLANLTGAGLEFTNLSGATLVGANLTLAFLVGANFTGADLTYVIWSHTTCPDGSVSDTNSPMTCIGHGGGL